MMEPERILELPVFAVSRAGFCAALRTSMVVIAVGFWGLLSGCSGVQLAQVVTGPTEPSDCEIAYTVMEDSGDRIYIVSDDGVSRRMLDIPGDTPAWSPDGSQIAFFSDSGDGRLYIFDADGSNVRSFELYITSFVQNATWSRDSTHIFVRSQVGLWWLDLAGDEFQPPLVWHTAEFPIDWARLSPDEQQVVFDRNVDDGIYILSIEQFEAHRLVAEGIRPVWSPDGSRVAFMAWNGDQLDIHIINADSTHHRNLTQLTMSKNSQYEWSPDGGQLVFVSDRDGNDEIYVMNEDGVGIRRLTNSSATDQRPHWSPAGTRIAFLTASRYSRTDRDLPTAYRIGIMNSDGTDLRYLPHEGLIRDLTWSPRCQ